MQIPRAHLGERARSPDTRGRSEERRNPKRAWQGVQYKWEFHACQRQLGARDRQRKVTGPWDMPVNRPIWPFRLKYSHVSTRLALEGSSPCPVIPSLPTPRHLMMRPVVLSLVILDICARILRSPAPKRRGNLVELCNMFGVTSFLFVAYYHPPSFRHPPSLRQSHSSRIVTHRHGSWIETPAGEQERVDAVV